MQNKFFGVMYSINIVAQAMFNLLVPAAVAFGGCWLLVNKAGAPGWLYAVLIPIATVVGFISMVRFVITAATALERLEKQNGNKLNLKNNKSGNNKDEE